VDSGYPAGTAAYLSPGSGSTAPTGTTVTIYVSDGTPYVAPQPQQPQQPQKQGGGNGGGGKKGHGKGKGH
jgi:beta-lactam-binding protein with PASTA domain